MAKKVTGYLKLQVPAGAANPSPPIGPALGQRGLNIMAFCKDFNAKTSQMEKGSPIPVVITIYGDKSFTFEMRTPPMSYFLKKAAKIESGSKTPGRDNVAKVTPAQVREIAEKKMADLNCDTVEAAMRMVEGSARSLGVAVFARGAKADEARAAGADVVGAEDLVAEVQGGKIDFDRVIATPDLMPLVGRLGKVLGPRGMMPNPKVGTVTMDVKSAVAGAKGGSVEFRVEKAGIVQAGVGKASFTAEALAANIRAFADAVQKARPAGAKGTFISRVAISSTMGPGVKVEPASLFGQ